MNILRVFPHKTSITPDDNMVRIGTQTMSLPQHDEVHISCTFTWDMDYCEYLQEQYQAITDKPVLLGGPAYNSPCDAHIPGLYTKQGVIFTSRGCNNNCPWCFVPEREGKLKELPVFPGNIINDNNFLQCSQKHQQSVFDMLRKQKQICFKGGLQPDLITVEFADTVRALKISELWLACDIDEDLIKFKKACAILIRAGFSRNHIRCYALIGDDMDKNEARLQEIWNSGAMPFAQLYQPPEREKKEYSMHWKEFARMWSRPAAIRAHMTKGTRLEDYRRIT